MRKLLSILLAVVMVASVAVVSIGTASAAETATVTITDLKGENAVTKTYAVGETFTAYLYLNTAPIDPAGIGSFRAEQTYTSDILEVAVDYEKDPASYEYGGIKDLAAVMPVCGNAGIASAHKLGYIHYNASKPGYDGFKFTSDDAELLVMQYTVKAAGEATITNSMTTLAVSDFNLTRIIDKGVIVKDNFHTSVALTDPAAPAGSKVSGTVTSYTTLEGTENEAVTVELIQNDEVAYSTTVTGNSASYELTGVADGDYILRFSKRNHVTRDYDLTVSGDTTAEAAKICPIGDANLDGKISPLDVAQMNNHIKGKKDLTGYNFLCADVIGTDSKIAPLDIAQINLHLKAKKSLWK